MDGRTACSAIFAAADDMLDVCRVVLELLHERTRAPRPPEGLRGLVPSPCHMMSVEHPEPIDLRRGLPVYHKLLVYKHLKRDRLELFVHLCATYEDAEAGRVAFVDAVRAGRGDVYLEATKSLWAPVVEVHRVVDAMCSTDAAMRRILAPL